MENQLCLRGSDFSIMIRKMESPDINMPELQVHFVFPVLFWCYMNFNSSDSNRIISGLDYLKGKEVF